MKAIIIKEAGSAENLIYTELPKPILKENEVLVKVKAIGINPIDVKARGNEGVLSWIYEDERPVVLGWDISGEVVDKDTTVQNISLGDEVFGMVNFFGNGKAYAEYVAVPAHQLALKPAHVSHEDAAAATLAALTAWQALFTHGNVKKGQRILIHAGSGGVGHFAIQFAKQYGAYVITTSSLKNKEFVLSLGADEHIDYHQEKFYHALSELDFVLDTIGGDTLSNSIDVLKPKGTLITLPSPDFEDEITEKANSKNIELTFIAVQSSGEDMKSIATLLEQKKIVSHVSATYAFEDMQKAHRHIETGRTVGKVVVTV